MLSWLQKKVGEHRARERLATDPVLAAVIHYTRQASIPAQTGFGSFSRSTQERLMGGLIDDVMNVKSQPNPLVSIRMRAMEFMLLAAECDVLIKQPHDAFPGISGALTQHMVELVGKDNGLSDYVYTLNPAPSGHTALWDAVLVRYWHMHFMMNSYNQARCAIGDWNSDPTKDWFQLCYRSFLIRQEDIYREQLGLPTVIPDEGSLRLRSLMHINWINIGPTGELQLRRRWENDWRESFHEPAPFEGQNLR